MPLMRLNVVNSNATEPRDQQLGKGTLILGLLTSYLKKKNGIGIGIARMYAESHSL